RRTLRRLRAPQACVPIPSVCIYSSMTVGASPIFRLAGGSAVVGHRLPPLLRTSLPRSRLYGIVAKARLFEPTCQIIWYESKYPQPEFIAIGPCDVAPLIVTVSDLVGCTLRKTKTWLIPRVKSFRSCARCKPPQLCARTHSPPHS